MRFNTSLLEAINSKVKLKLISHLINQEAPMSERELSTIIGVSHMSVNRLMKNLQALNLVDLERVGKSSLWRMNKRSYTFRALSKAIKGLSKIFDPLEHLKMTIRKHLPVNYIEELVLFGSIAEKKETATSDVDLFILVKNNKHKRKLVLFLDKLEGACLTLYGNTLSPFIFTKKELDSKKDLLILNKINKGLIIYSKPA